MSDQLQKLKDIAILLKDSIGKEEFTKAFSSLVDFVKRVERDLTKKIDEETQLEKNQLQELNQLYSEAIRRIETDNESNLSNLKRWALKRVGDIFIESGLEKKVSEKLAKVDSKLSEIVLPNTSVVALEASKMALDEVLPLIPTKIELVTELPKLGEPIRDALELLQGDDRLSMSAIKGLQEKLERILSFAKNNLNIGGGLSIPRTVDVFGETPTGTINGTNTDFTLSFAPVSGSVQVYRGGARQKLTEDYTISGSVITFLIAPQVGEIIICDYKR